MDRQRPGEGVIPEDSVALRANAEATLTENGSDGNGRPSPNQSRDNGTQSNGASPPASGALQHAPEAPLEPATVAQPSEARPRAIRRPQSWAQRIAGLLIAAACIVAVAWYVPRIVSADGRLFTGAVASGGVLTLNFPNPGEIDKVKVRAGEAVRRGEVLATEQAPDSSAVVAAERAAIAADNAKIAQVKAAEAQGQSTPTSAVPQLAVATAQLSLDEAQLTADHAKLAESRIVAPAAGTVVATNGQPGEVVTSSGIKDYAVDSKPSSASVGPKFSLLPEGPQTLRSTTPRISTLPVIALRTSAAWSVDALIPEDSVAKIAPGRAITISVPAAGITGLRGEVEEVVPTPITTTDGTAYQAVIGVTGRAENEPLNGMAADVQLGS